MTDPIADMLNQIKNAQALSREEVKIPFSKLKYEIAKILEREKFIEKIEKPGKKERKVIKINLKYDKNKPAIVGLKRVSKPGRRVYFPVESIKSIKGGYGIAIISTSKGLMTNRQARKEKIGGEVICEIW